MTILLRVPRLYALGLDASGGLDVCCVGRSTDVFQFVSVTWLHGQSAEGLKSLLQHSSNTVRHKTSDDVDRSWDSDTVLMWNCLQHELMPGCD